MTKIEVIEKCKKQPYYVPLVLFEIYEDDDMIPEELVEMTFEKPEPREMIYYTGIESGKLLDEVIKEHIKYGDSQADRITKPKIT